MSDLITMFESASVLLLSVFLMTTVRSRLAKRPVLVSIVLGVMFAIVGIEVMENAIELAPGIRTDPRAAVVVLAGAVGGPLAVAICAPVLALHRLHFGGVGAVEGAIYVVGSGIAAALLYCWWFKAKRRAINLRYVVLQAIVAGTVPTLILIFVSKASPEIFYLSNALMAPVNFGAALLIGILMLRENRLQRAFRDSLDQREQIDAIANNAPATLFQIQRQNDAEPRFSYISNGASPISNDLQELIGQDCSTLECILSAENIAKLKEHLDVSERDMAPLSVEFEIISDSAGMVVLQMDAGIRRGRSGQTIWDGTISDVTERKQTERMKDEFISNVSHELRTPLTSIRGSIGLIVGNAGDELPTRVKGMLEIANRNAERLVLLINDILDMQKIASGQMQFSLKRQMLRPILEQCVITTQSYDPIKKVRIVLRDDALRAESNVDADRLNQVLINLLSNAIKFSPSGATIIASIQRRGRFVRMSVSDEGPGIPDEFRDQIFKRFRQVESSSTRKAGGTGLGLNISKAITEAMGGTIGFTSDVGMGSTFYIDLPAADLHDAAQSAFERALVCSNDQILTQTIRTALESEQIVTHIAPDLGSATALLANAGYVAVVMDLSTTYDTEDLVWLQKYCNEDQASLVVVDSETEPDLNARKAINGTDADWVTKPVDDARIYAIFQQALSMVEHGKPRVLYIEDDAAIQQVIGYSLETDVDIVAAQSLSEARDALANESFDVVLLDLNLPDGSGFEILEELPDQLPVVIFSALELDQDTLGRAAAVLIKSRHREHDVAAAVLAALPRHVQLGGASSNSS